MTQRLQSSVSAIIVLLTTANTASVTAWTPARNSSAFLSTLQRMWPDEGHHVLSI